MKEKSFCEEKGVPGFADDARTCICFTSFCNHAGIIKISTQYLFLFEIIIILIFSTIRF